MVILIIATTGCFPHLMTRKRNYENKYKSPAYKRRMLLKREKRGTVIFPNGKIEKGVYESYSKHNGGTWYPTE